MRHGELRERFLWKSDYFQNLGIAVGVNAGPVFVGSVGSEIRCDYTVIGHPVNLARRLCSAARADEVLTTKRTLEGTDGLFSSEFVAHASFKGELDFLDVYRIAFRIVPSLWRGGEKQERREKRGLHAAHSDHR